ncbi:uncharacterized protein [Musca autumnalis]|uniref:uncharacterized protein n=1 Tax=Musca autumnalis TaxID=221902 RepID=UPI003CEC9CD2
MASASFNKIVFNSDVMIHIYKFLNIGDQLRLAQVNANLRSIFLQFISPITFNKLEIYQYDEENYILSNDTDTDRILVRNSEDLEEFQKFYGCSVYDLFAHIRVRMEFFKNLVKLQWYNVGDFTIDDMVQITNNLPNLEELQVHAHNFEIEPTNGCIAPAIVKELFRLVKLKKFVLKISFICHIKFKDFYEIVTQLPLEIIETNLPILFDSDDNEFEFQQSPLPLMQLETGNKGIDRSFSSMINSFRNLNVLTIKRSCTEMVHALESLTQLHQLTIWNTDFGEEENVILPPNLTTLHLISCKGLLLDHLQQFLHEHSNPKLIEFVAHGTDFRIEEFKELHISPRIKTLNTGRFDLNQFRSPFVENSALENLTLHGHFCIGHLTLDNLLILKNLKKLSLSLTLPEEGFYVIRILQELPLLRELIVRESIFKSSSSPSLQAVVTSVTCLKIFCYESSDDIMGFWFDMFSLNPELELQMHVEIDEDDPSKLQNLIQHEKFPRNLRKIKICGFTLDCNKLRNHFESVLKTINCNIYDYEPFYPFQRKCNIIMSRNNK